MRYYFWVAETAQGFKISGLAYASTAMEAYLDVERGLDEYHVITKLEAIE